MNSLALLITTEEGSAFLARFDELGQEGEILYGVIHIIGFSKLIGQQIEFRGKGCMPEPEGRIVVSSDPYDIIQMEDEIFPIYPYETILSVKEIDPHQLLNQ